MAKRKASSSGRRTVGIGLVGLGFMGLTHFRAAQAARGGRVVAMVTSDPRKARGDFSRVKGNFGDGGDQVDLKGIRVYPSLDELLADDKVDLIDICLPSYLHADVAVRCLRAGKSVLVEKPVALQPADARRMLKAADSAPGLLMVAQVLKFFPEFEALEKAARTGQYGELLSLHHRRIIAKPNWSDDDWLGDPTRSGGMVIDLHIHDTDFVVHLLGAPRAVSSRGLVRDDRVDSIRTSYDYGSDGPLVTSEAGWINAPSLPFEHGFDAYFEKATIQYNSTTCPQATVFGARKSSPLRVGKKDGFEAELGAAIRSVRDGAVDPRLSAASAAQSLSVCLAEERSARSGRTVAIRG